jgi:cytochrome b
MAQEGVRARLWDWPTRLVHWALVGLIAFAWWSSEENLTWHRWSGYAVIGLLAFRILWGFAGSRTAQFASFVRGPAATVAYLRTLPSRKRAETPGHNPVGAWSVVAILAVLIVQVVTGLFAVDIDAFEGGPLSDLVSFDLGRRIAEWHELAFTVLQVLVVLHVAAVAFYLIYKRTNLIGAMFTGRQRFERDPGLAFAPLWRTVVVALLAAAFAWWASKGFRP